MVDCKNSHLLTTLRLASVAKLNAVVRPPVLNRKRYIPKICDGASGRTDCHGIYPQRDGKKSNNHWISIYTINRMGRVCPGFFPSTLNSGSPDWVRTSSRENLFVFYCSVDRCSYRRRRAVLTAEVSLISKLSITKLNKRKYEFKTRDYGADQGIIRVIATHTLNPLYCRQKEK